MQLLDFYSLEEEKKRKTIDVRKSSIGEVINHWSKASDCSISILSMNKLQVLFACASLQVISKNLENRVLLMLIFLAVLEKCKMT